MKRIAPIAAIILVLCLTFIPGSLADNVRDQRETGILVKSERRTKGKTVSFELAAMLTHEAILLFSPPAPVVETFVVTNSNDDGFGSFRRAIENANANPGLDEITFSIVGPRTIRPSRALPRITDPVNIVGSSGGDRVELDGSSAGANADGLRMVAGGSSVSGMVINRFRGAGIVLQNAENNTVQDCYIGTDVTGTIAMGNRETGIAVKLSSDNTIGPGNVISGNGKGIEIVNTSRNTVRGNKIGTDHTGLAFLGNTGDGVSIERSSDNLIGGDQANEGNLISANTGNGILIEGQRATVSFP